MSQDAYTDRCTVLSKWLEIRKAVTNIKRVYEGMPSTHTAYKQYSVMIEEYRHELVLLQREFPWLDKVLEALGDGT